MTQKFSLNDLIPADSDGSRMPTARSAETRKELRARAMAREWIRNGMHIGQAFKTVTGFDRGDKSLTQILRHNMDDFVDELRGLVEASKVDQTALLNMLWELIHISILDYFDDNGNVMPVRELKKMSRVHQALIDKIDVSTKQVTVRDENGKVMVDDNGRPYLQTEQVVTIQLPPKLFAVESLAKIMKWIGPQTVVNNNTTNVAVMMTEKDAHVRRLNAAYDPANVIEGQVVREDSGSR